MGHSAGSAGNLPPRRRRPERHLPSRRAVVQCAARFTFAEDERQVTLPVNLPSPSAGASPIAGSVLPIQRAEELLATLPGVISVRIVAGVSGAVDEIHLLTTEEVSPKQTVRNVESALLAHLGMRVSHKKISVATSTDGQRMRQSGGYPMVPVAPEEQPPAPATGPGLRRTLVFEDIEVRRSRTRGVACRVTLRKGDESYSGESEGADGERLRVELAARATLAAIAATGEERVLAVEGCKVVDAFEREFVFVGLSTRIGRETAVLTGTAEVKESPETASVLAVLDATNRWIAFAK